MRPRSLVYLGTPAMSVPPLRALHAAGFHIPLVVTNPDTRRGRGSSTAPSPVKAAAAELGLAVSPDVDDVLLEMAWFDPIGIVRSSRRHKLRSEASARFEKSPPSTRYFVTPSRPTFTRAGHFASRQLAPSTTSSRATAPGAPSMTSQ